MSEKVVLDASALLALLKEEPGHEYVKKILPTAIMSSINISETIAVLIELGIPIQDAENATTDVIKDIIPFDTEQACLAAALRTQTRSHGLSLGDRACLSLAKISGLTAVTANRVWSKLHIDKLSIHIIR